MLRNFITYGLFPSTFVGAMLAASWSIVQGYHPTPVLAVITAGTLLVVALCERLHPEHVQWNRARGDVGTDFWHGLVSNVSLPELLKFGLLTIIAGVGLGARGLGVWPDHWHLGLQLPLALVVGQFGEYWAHRALHEVPFLWRFHAVHHSPERLYFLNAARFHPVDNTLLFCVGIAPLILLGAGPQLLLLVLTWIAVHGLFQHCNVRLRLGPLNYLFSMAELHRWHHSENVDEANRNYGNNILFWDIVFGTVFWPKDRNAAEAVGNNIPGYPTTYLAQLWAPFRLQQWPGSRRSIEPEN